MKVSSTNPALSLTSPAFSLVLDESLLEDFCVGVVVVLGDVLFELPFSHIEDESSLPGGESFEDLYESGDHLFLAVVHGG